MPGRPSGGPPDTPPPPETPADRLGPGAARPEQPVDPREVLHRVDADTLGDSVPPRGVVRDVGDGVPVPAPGEGESGPTPIPPGLVLRPGSGVPADSAVFRDTMVVRQRPALPESVAGPEGAAAEDGVAGPDGAVQPPVVRPPGATLPPGFQPGGPDVQAPGVRPEDAGLPPAVPPGTAPGDLPDRVPPRMPGGVPGPAVEDSVSRQEPPGAGPGGAPRSSGGSRPPPRSAGATPAPAVPMPDLTIRPASAPEPDSIVARTGLWAFAGGLTPTEDAFLYRLAQAEWARRTLREGGLLKPEVQAREDSIGMRLLPPRRSGARIPDGLTPQVSGQVDAGTVEIWRTLRETPVAPRVRMRQPDYVRRLTRANYRDLVVAESKRAQLAAAGTQSRKGLVKVDLPFELPSAMQSVFGEGKPNLSVSGSERISFAGTSRWRPSEQANEIARRQSKFPQLDMKQELNLKLTGTIGDKVSVDVDQSSQAMTPLANRIKIHYKGYEDEILQRVDLGNTSLNLPGTQYVSYGGRAEGLFGINAVAKIGDVDITTILSKQEGKSDSKSVSRTAETRTVKIDDIDYVHGKYFFLRNPNGCPWELDQSSLYVYVDDKNPYNDVVKNAYPAAVTVTGAPTSPDSVHTYRGKFHRLLPEDHEYSIQESIYSKHPMLVLNAPLDENHVLAVQYRGWELDGSYQQRNDITVGNSQGDTLRLMMLRPSRSDDRVDERNLRAGVWGPTRVLEMRNVYDLGARDILEEGFTFRIRLKRTFGGTIEPDRIGSDSTGVTFLQMTGLDLSRRVGSDLRPGRDDRVDDFFISYQSGQLVFPDLRPFDPDSADLCFTSPNCYGDNLCRFLFPGSGDIQRAPRPRILPGVRWPGTDSTTAADSAAIYRAPAIYDRSLIENPDLYSKYYLEVTYRSPVSRIQLNAFGILPGSEVVTASGRTLVRDREYTIDYEIGEVEILDAANVTESDEIRVTYSYQGFGAMGSSKTLAGTSFSYRPEASAFNFSSSWLYESKGGVPGLEGRRPRLGQEPSRTVVGELAGAWKGESMFLTRLIDRLPALDARIPAKLEFGFGAGLSLPNPNTKDKLYIDDFDGAKDVLALSMNRRVWRPPSIPAPRDGIRVGTPLGDSLVAEPSAATRGELWWFSPRDAAQERDRQPTLDPREADDNWQILRFRHFPRGLTPEERVVSWGGVTTVLSKRGTDLSRAQFLDVWINDGIPYWEDSTSTDPARKRRGKLILDIGTVSEDALWYRNDPLVDQPWPPVPGPNRRLDTEDFYGEPDGQLDLGDQANEDVGFDQIEHGRPGADPFDVYQYDDTKPDSDRDKYARVNGTEGNQELDTEDLDGEGDLDDANSYFQVEIDLGDPTLWETDVWRDYPAHRGQLEATNGWRRIRIPLRNVSLVRPQTTETAAPPIWEKIFHLRAWVTGFERETTLEIGGIEITGNRWFENAITGTNDRPIPAEGLEPGEEFFVGVLNNKDDAAVYDPPIATRKEDDIREREQSVTLNMRNFLEGHRVSIYRTYPARQDYTLYENMEFYVKRRLEEGSAPSVNLSCAVRLCRDAASDTTNYYEYKLPVTDDWNLVRIDFGQLSRLALDSTGVDTVSGGAVIRRVGSPSLTSIQRIAFLITNEGGARRLERGSVWIDELHLTGVKKDRGMAGRFALTADLPRLGRLSFNWERRAADFLKIGQDRGSGTTSTAWNLNAQTDLFGYAEKLGVNSTLRGSLNRQTAVPKFRTDSDLILEEAEDDDIAVTANEDISLSLARRRGEQWWSRWVLEPFSVSGNWRRAISRQPMSQDTTVTTSGTVGWTLPLEQWGDITLGGKSMTKLRYLPTSLSATVTGSRATGRRYSRTSLDGDFARQPDADRTTASLQLSSGLRPITPILYQITSARDLMLRDDQLTLAGLNLGREVSRQQTLNGNWQPPVLRQMLNPTLNWQGNSTLRLATLNTAGAQGEPDRSNEFQNTRTAGVQGRVSISELFKSIRSIGGGSDSAGAVARPAGQGTGLGRLVRLAPINGNLSFTKQSGFTSQQGLPGILYQLALVDDPGGSSKSLSRSRARFSTGRNLNLDTSVQLPSNVSVTARYSSGTTEGKENNAATNNLTRKWPDLTISWGSMHQRLKIDRWFRSFSATTGYNREFQESGSSQSPRDRTSDRTNFAPLLNVNASLKNGVSVNLTSSLRSSQDDLYQPSRNTSTRDEKQVGLGLKKTINLTRRMTIPLTGRTQTVQTRLDLNADFDWRTSNAWTRQMGRRPTLMEDRVNWKFSAGAGYQFTQNINGTGSVNFGQDKDKKNSANTANFIGIAISASFTF